MPGFADKGVFRQLEETFGECSSEGWDGDRAKPISKEVLQNAGTLLESFPSGVKPPQTGAEPDGAVSLEWYQSPEKVVSLSVSASGKIYYAAIVGGRRRHGQGFISAGISDDLLALIRNVNGIT